MESQSVLFWSELITGVPGGSHQPHLGERGLCTCHFPDAFGKHHKMLLVHQSCSVHGRVRP